MYLNILKTEKNVAILGRKFLDVAPAQEVKFNFALNLSTSTNVCSAESQLARTALEVI